MADNNLRLSRTASSRKKNDAAGGSNLTRRVTGQERIENILEIGRQRAESRRNTQTDSAPQTTLRMDPLLGSSSRAGHPADNSSDDEQAGPDSGRHVNYQATAESASPKTRVRKRTGISEQSVGLGVDGASADRDHAANEGTKDETAGESWWRSRLRPFQSITLENKGSVARDHLALERTFLAWLRTSLAFASIGVAITQLFRLNITSNETDEDKKTNHQIATLRQVGKPLGATFLAISILILFLGYNRYHQSQQWVIKGKFPASRGTIILVTLLAFLLMIASLVVVVVIAPQNVHSSSHLS